VYICVMEDRKLQILEKTEPRLMSDGSKRIIVKVVCFCGKIFESHLSSINQGLTKSCGCLVKQRLIERTKTDSSFKTSHPLYRVWISMRTRCNNKNHFSYKYYGGRGISVHPEWESDYNSFFEWCIRNGYKKTLQLDRSNNDGNYEPDNCRFVTAMVNGRNKRNTVLIPYNGESRTLKEWSEVLDIPYGMLYSRIKNQGKTPEEAFIKPKTEVMIIDLDISDALKTTIKDQGITQRWVVKKMIQKGCESIDEVKFSNKLKGMIGFTENEIILINEILGTSFVLKKEI